MIRFTNSIIELIIHLYIYIYTYTYKHTHTHILKNHIKKYIKKRETIFNFNINMQINIPNVEINRILLLRKLIQIYNLMFYILKND